MANNFCQNCGRELTDGEVCNCTSANVQPENTEVIYNEPVQAEQVEQPQPERVEPQQEYIPQQEFNPQQGAYDPNQQYYTVPPVYYPQEPMAVPARTDYPEGYKIKKKYVAVILAAALGPLGIHNFYLGNNSKAIAQLLLSTVGAMFLIGPVISAVWALVETVMLLTESIDRDADGYKIQTIDEAFNKKD